MMLLALFMKIIIENYKNIQFIIQYSTKKLINNSLMYLHIRLIYLIFNHIIIFITLIPI